MKYAVVFDISGRVTVKVDALDRNDAIRAANKQMFIETDFGEVEDVSADVVYAERLITRDDQDDSESLALVRCMDCGWVGIEAELESGGSLSDPYCPDCGNAAYIVPFNPSMPLNTRDIVQLWDIFCALVDLNSDNEIMFGFYCFPAGTHISKVREWFESRYEGGIPALNKAINRKEL